MNTYVIMESFSLVDIPISGVSFQVKTIHNFQLATSDSNLLCLFCNKFERLTNLSFHIFSLCLRGTWGASRVAVLHSSCYMLKLKKKHLP